MVAELKSLEILSKEELDLLVRLIETNTSQFRTGIF